MKTIVGTTWIVAIVLIHGTTRLHASVRINGTGFNYPTIQAAVNASGDGDRLFVLTGRYAENVTVISKQITIEGGYLDFIARSSNPALTSLDGKGADQCLVVLTNAVVTVEGMGITNGATFRWGGGIYAGASSVVTARECAIQGNVAMFGGGCAAGTNSHIVMLDTALTRNMAVVGGGAGASDRGACLVLNGSNATCYGNYASIGGGIAVLGSGTLAVGGGATVYGNTANTEGGGIYLSSGASGMIGPDATVGGKFLGGNAVTNGDGGGIYVDTATLVVSGAACKVFGNVASGNGGGIYVINGTVTVTDGASIGNSGFLATGNSAQNHGGGIYAWASALVISNGARIYNNQAGGYGGGICAFCAYTARVVICSATIGDGTLLMPGNRAFECGGLLVEQGIDVRVQDSLIAGNQATGDSGGLGLAESSKISFTNTVIAWNAAPIAGALFISEASNVMFTDCQIVSNTAHDQAGFCADQIQDCVLTSVRVAGNVATSSFGGLFLSGGSSMTMRKCAISNNRANIVGGMRVNASTVHATDCSFVGNVSALDGGGGISLLDSVVSLQSAAMPCQIASNTAGSGAGAYVSNSVLSLLAPTPGTPIRVTANAAAGNGGGILLLGGSSLTVSGAVQFAANTAYSGGAICAMGSNTAVSLCGARIGMPGQGNTALGQPPADASCGGGGMLVRDNAELTAIDTEFTDNMSSNNGGGILAYYAGPTTIGSTFGPAPAGMLPPTVFSGNRATGLPANGAGVGGGLLVFKGNGAAIANAAFISNSASMAAGGAYLGSTNTTVVNVLAANNSGAGRGDGFFTVFVPVSFQECTIANNLSNGIAASASAPPFLQNCIVWGHLAYQVTNTATIQFSDIQGGAAGPFNITNNPSFLNPAGLDYQLAAGSPCIDMGMTLLSVTNDCIGAPRPIGTNWDMGAYEFVPEPATALVMGCLLCVPRRRAGRRI